MIVKTTRFGDLDIPEDMILDFIIPVIGFEDVSKYFLYETDNNKVFKWLQSSEYPDLAFPVTHAAYFGIQYDVEIDDETMDKLDIKTAEDVNIINIVNIPQGKPNDATINLIAPVIINTNIQKAGQIILKDGNYSVAQKLFDTPLEDTEEEG